MKIIETSIPEVKLIEAPLFTDSRGWFAESWSEERLASGGLHVGFRQDNHSFSTKGVLRGLHYQLGKPQGKLVRVTSGVIFDVSVDIRQGSPTFGQWVGVELGSPQALGKVQMLWMPEGFAHGFLTLSDGAEVLYKSTDVYFPPGERTILWSDADLGIQWPLDGLSPVISAKDNAGASLAESELPYYEALVGSRSARR